MYTVPYDRHSVKALRNALAQAVNKPVEHCDDKCRDECREESGDSESVYKTGDGPQDEGIDDKDEGYSQVRLIEWVGFSGRGLLNDHERK